MHLGIKKATYHYAQSLREIDVELTSKDLS